MKSKSLKRKLALNKRSVAHLEISLPGAIEKIYGRNVLGGNPSQIVQGGGCYTGTFDPPPNCPNPPGKVTRLF